MLKNQIKKDKKELNFQISWFSEDFVESLVFVVVLLFISFISRSLAPLSLSVFFLPLLLQKGLEILGLKKLASWITYFVSFLIVFTSLLVAFLRSINSLDLEFQNLQIVWVGLLLLIFFSILSFYKRFGNILKQKSFWFGFLKFRWTVFSVFILGLLMYHSEMEKIFDLAGTFIIFIFASYLIFPKIIQSTEEKEESESEIEEEKELDTGVKENEAIKRLGDLTQVISVDHFETWFGEEYVVWAGARLAVRDTISQENMYVTKVKAKKILKSLGCQQIIIEIMYKSEESV